VGHSRVVEPRVDQHAGGLRDLTALRPARHASGPRGTPSVTDGGWAGGSGVGVTLKTGTRTASYGERSWPLAFGPKFAAASATDLVHPRGGPLAEDGLGGAPALGLTPDRARGLQAPRVEGGITGWDRGWL